MSSTPESTDGRAGKGRPTPKRQPSKGPVAPPPLTRKEAAKRVREANAAKRQQVRGGRVADEAYFIPRDAGPVRRLVRDLVDSRRTTATLLLPAAVLPLLGGLTGNSGVEAFTTALWIMAITLALADFVGATIRIRKAIHERHPEEKRTRRHVFYGIVRMLQFRRLRVPKPAVSVGDPV